MSYSTMTIKSVEINGVTYPSITKAAQALGIDRKTVCRQLKRGEAPHKALPPSQEKLIEINGVTYPSMKKAAQALGITYCTLNHQLKRGETPHAARWTTKKKPVEIDGVRYESCADAARALNPGNVSHDAMCRRVRIGKLVCDPDQYSGFIHPIAITTPAGREFKSLAKLAKSLGVSDWTIYKRRQEGRPIFDRCSLGNKRNSAVTIVTQKDLAIRNDYEVYTFHYLPRVQNEDTIIEECERRLRKYIAHGNIREIP